jgi:hypothetical protein
LLPATNLINKCIHSYADTNVRREGPRPKKLDKEIKHNEALTKMVIGFMRKEQEEMVESAEKKEASRSKIARTCCPDGLMGTKCAPRLSIVGGSSAPRPPAQALILDVYVWYCLCVINLVNMMHAYMHEHDGNVHEHDGYIYIVCGCMNVLSFLYVLVWMPKMYVLV